MKTNKQIREESIETIQKHWSNTFQSPPPKLERMHELEELWKNFDIYQIDIKYEAYDSIGWFVDINDHLDSRKDDEVLFLDLFTAALRSTAKYLNGELEKKEDSNGDNA